MNIQRRDFLAPGETSDATVATIIAQHVALRPERPAIVVSKDNLLTYGALGALIAAFGAALRANGIGPTAKVAIILPDGPELALAIVATACNAVAVPLNPKLTASEIEDLFTALHVDGMVMSDRADSVGRRVAAQHGVCILETSRDRLGILGVSGSAAAVLATTSLASSECVQPDAPAIILQTSATTGRPKLVPLTHRNLMATAETRKVLFDLTLGDRALCATPLYYSQALKGMLLTSLILGGSVACPDREAEGDILKWLEDLAPTWLAAAPAFYLNLTERALAQREPPRHCLRFIRSDAAPLSAAVRQGLEDVFGVPILEGYGLTETGTVAANTIAHRKPGTVGRPSPLDVAIRADDGRLLPPGETGEIVVRGPAVMPGYLCNEEANHAAFVNGWFLTGDLGSIDAEGYLTILGRRKEFISRGGEKISPHEVELALLLHPSVREAVAFSVPHPRLGENVAAAVVLMPGANTTPREIKAFLSDHLASFKIPQRVFLKTELPKGPYGKPLRHQLSKGAVDRVSDAVPAWAPLQVQILEIWKRLLGRTDVGIDDDFFEAGGDSLLYIQMICEIEAYTRQKIPASALRDVFTVRDLDAAIMRGGPAIVELVTCAKEGQGTPFLFCHGDFMSRGLYALNLVDMLSGDQPVLLLHPHIDPDPKLTIEEMARSYIPHVLAVQPNGEFRLGGFCNGGYLAWEIACQLNALGRQVEFVLLIDTSSINARPALRALAKLVKFVVAFAPKKISNKFERDGMSSVWSRLWQRYPVSPYSNATRNYIPSKLKTRLICALTEETRGRSDYSATPWTNIASEVNRECVVGTHLTCVTTHIGDFATLLNRLLK